MTAPATPSPAAPCPAAPSLAETFPALQELRRQRAAEAAPAADVTLLRLCADLRTDRRAEHRFGVVEPKDWDSFHQYGEALQGLIQRIADTPATTRVGLRAKALALHALLDEGGGLYEDAATPDRLAWSLVHDILVA